MGAARPAQHGHAAPLPAKAAYPQVRSSSAGSPDARKGRPPGEQPARTGRRERLRWPYGSQGTLTTTLSNHASMATKACEAEQLGAEFRTLMPL